MTQVTTKANTSTTTTTPIIKMFNDSVQLRCVQDDAGKVWMVAKDIVEAVGISVCGGITKYTNHIPEEWKDRLAVPTLGGVQELVCLSPDGVGYYLERSLSIKSQEMLKWLMDEGFIKHKTYLTIDKQYCFGRDIINNLFSRYKIEEEYYVDGYYLDWYIPELNLAIEFDEPYHKSDTQQKKDIEREMHIVSKLGCKFLRYQC